MWLGKVNEPRLSWCKRAGRSDVASKDKRTKRAVAFAKRFVERRILHNVDVPTQDLRSFSPLVPDLGKEFEGEREEDPSQALEYERRRERGKKTDHIERAIWRETEKRLSCLRLERIF